MVTLISVRRFRDQAVNTSTLEELMMAATSAPSPANSQPWEFVLVKSPEKKGSLAKINLECASTYIRNRKVKMDEQRIRYLQKSLRRMAEAPAMLVLCVNWKRAGFMNKTGGLAKINKRLEQVATYGAVFPAMQNLLLSARSMGLGCWISMYHYYNMTEFRSVLNLPAYVEPVATICIGYPTGRFKPVRRESFRKRLHVDGW
jgi:nitroreductase